jgi:hypothetical protein
VILEEVVERASAAAWVLRIQPMLETGVLAVKKRWGRLLVAHGESGKMHPYTQNAQKAYPKVFLLGRV